VQGRSETLLGKGLQVSCAVVLTSDYGASCESDCCGDSADDESNQDGTFPTPPPLRNGKGRLVWSVPRA